MPRHWFIKTKSGKAGPITSKQLVRLAGQGKIKPNAGVSPDGQSWVKAKHVEGLPFPEPEPKRWLVKTKAGDAGPFTIRKLCKLVREGRVRSNFAVSCDGQHWIKAEQIPELRFPEPIPREPAYRDACCSSPDVPPPSPGAILERRSEWAQQRHAEYLRRFGPITQIARQPPEGIRNPIDVYVHAPSAKRPFTTLVSSGMSDLAMAVPQGSCSPRAELVFYVQSAHAVHIDLLRFLAQVVHGEQHPLSYGSLMNNGNPATPIFQGSSLDAFVFMIPNLESDFQIQQSLRIDNDPLQLLWVVPITGAERDFIAARGMRQFCELLDRSGHSLLLNPFRRSYVDISNSLAG